jgi:hypothetical protein
MSIALQNPRHAIEGPTLFRPLVAEQHEAYWRIN